ncbi:variable surface protein Vir18-like [Plasmodium vivax]|uniref:Variable surface protein Vir18-like n=1 Tax=Plasmodium vivax (strain Salvador I) TaxID=126793 RepID=A5KD46_PLAVS|nr:variable surface protein Vir18-like [Plasmodium vivax]EDL42723.1 variable surface protein Vir18-like [Plasmodium vivax]|eukprot:XP_001612516.1 variable surface protein Vir18-like [Plasmodium vivax Sal-1]
MADWRKRNSMVTDMYQKLYGPTCTSDYIKTKTEIEHKIDKFNYSDPKNYCRNCHEIRKNITEKSKQLQHCYRLSGFHPIESIYRIKEFINKCPDPPKCKNPVVPPPNRPVPEKQTNKDPCRGDAKCKPKTVPAKEQKAKSPGLVSRNPKSRSPEVQNSLERNIGSSKEKVNSLKEPQTTPSTGSLGTQDDRSKSIVRQSSVNPETISRDTGDSHSSSSSQVEDIKKGISAADQPGGQNAGCNQHQDQCVRAQINQGLIDDNKEAAAANSVNGSIVDKSTLGEEHVDGQHPSRIQDTSGITTPSNNLASGDEFLVPQGGIGTGGDGGHNHDASHSPNSDHIDVLRVNTADGESSGIEGSHSLRVVSDVLCNGDSCITGQGDELTDDVGDKSGIFNKIFSTIQANKDNVINTSIPMGIVLLLSLLFKYTPLWRILTKRNRKKQSHMNEKLQRVLQQPSIGSEERSVPFSYSAFEYSS